MVLVTSFSGTIIGIGTFCESNDENFYFTIILSANPITAVVDIVLINTAVVTHKQTIDSPELKLLQYYTVVCCRFPANEPENTI